MSNQEFPSSPLGLSSSQAASAFVSALYLASVAAKKLIATFYDYINVIARESVMECAAICDVIILTEPRLKQSDDSAKQTLEQITRILTIICSKN